MIDFICQRKSEGKQYLIVYLILLMFFLALNAPMVVSAEEPAIEKSVLTVTVAKPLQQQWANQVPTSGWLEPWHEAIVSAELGGLKITDIYVDIGDVVKKGQPLARLSQEVPLIELRRQEAVVAAGKAEFAVAKANANRSRQLKKSAAQAMQEYDQMINLEQVAAASLTIAGADLDQQRVKLEQTTIVAIDDGIISSRTATLGAVVSHGVELFRLIRQQRVEWQAEIANQHLAVVKPGQSVVIQLSDKQTATGRVRAVSPTANKESGRTLIYVDVDATDNHLRAGTYVSGAVTLHSSAVLTVPDSALLLRDGFSYVYTLQADDQRVSRQRVETGRYQGGRIEIISGLTTDDLVVQAGGAFLSDDSVVTVVEGAS